MSAMDTRNPNTRLRKLELFGEDANNYSQMKSIYDNLICEAKNDQKEDEKSLKTKNELDEKRKEYAKLTEKTRELKDKNEEEKKELEQQKEQLRDEFNKKWNELATKVRDFHSRGLVNSAAGMTVAPFYREETFADIGEAASSLGFNPDLNTNDSIAGHDYQGETGSTPFINNSTPSGSSSNWGQGEEG